MVWYGEVPLTYKP